MLRYLVSLIRYQMKILKKMTSICKELGMDLNPYNIESCYILPSGQVNRSNNKRVIPKLVTRKYS